MTKGMEDDMLACLPWFLRGPKPKLEFFLVVGKTSCMKYLLHPPEKMGHIIFFRHLFITLLNLRNLKNQNQFSSTAYVFFEKKSVCPTQNLPKKTEKRTPSPQNPGRFSLRIPSLQRRRPRRHRGMSRMRRGMSRICKGGPCPARWAPSSCKWTGRCMLKTPWFSQVVSELHQQLPLFISWNVAGVGTGDLQDHPIKISKWKKKIYITTNICIFSYVHTHAHLCACKCIYIYTHTVHSVNMYMYSVYIHRHKNMTHSNHVMWLGLGPPPNECFLEICIFRNL